MGPLLPIIDLGNLQMKPARKWIGGRGGGAGSTGFECNMTGYITVNTIGQQFYITSYIAFISFNITDFILYVIQHY